MEDIYKGLRAIIIFVILMLMVSTIFNDKTAEKFGMFILFSMLILNAEKFADLTTTLTNVLKDSETE